MMSQMVLTAEDETPCEEEAAAAWTRPGPPPETATKIPAPSPSAVDVDGLAGDGLAGDAEPDRAGHLFRRDQPSDGLPGLQRRTGLVAGATGPGHDVPDRGGRHRRVHEARADRVRGYPGAGQFGG